MVVRKVIPKKAEVKRSKTAPTQALKRQTQPQPPTKQHSNGTANKVETTAVPIKAGVKRNNTTPIQAPKLQTKRQPEPPTEIPTIQRSKGTAKVVKPTVTPTKAGVKRSNTCPIQGPKLQPEPPTTQCSKGTSKMVKTTVIPTKAAVKESKTTPIQAPKKKCIRNYKITRIDGKCGFKSEMRNGFLEVVEVEPKSPADRKLIVSDQISVINKVLVDSYTTDDEIIFLLGSDVLALKILRDV